MRPLLAAVALATLGACGGDSKEDWPAGRPRIDRLAFVQQTPGRPSELEFQLAFTDTDGDLGGGALILSIDGDERSRLSLDDLFASQTPPLGTDAKIGELDVLVELGAEIEIGGEIELGFRLEDRDEEQSNEPTIRLKAVMTG